MQKGNMTDFDLFVKRSLQDAEEEVSPRVWSGIESRLAAMEAQKAAAASRKNHSFGWGWPVAALAMAAVLAAVIILPGTKRNSNLINHNDTTLLTDASTGRQVTVSGQDGGEPVTVSEVPAASGQNSASGRQQLRPAGRVSAPVISEGQAKSQESSAPAQQKTLEPQAGKPAVQEPQAAEPAAQEPKTQHEVVTPAAGQPDEFARMAYEDQMSRKAPVRISALAGGNLGAGNSASSAPLYGVSAKNDYIPSEIQEQGESSYSIPFSVGVGVRFELTPRLSIGTGVDYSLLSRNFNGSLASASGAVTKGDIRHDMQYIGVPLNIYFNLLGSGSLRLFAFGTGEAEWALSSKYTLGDQRISYKVNGTQFSAGGGLGVEFRITDGFGIYAAPNARYYFNCGQPKSIRTEKPFLINFNAGLHFYF